MPTKPHILRSDAIVLRSIEFSETSRIVTLYTRERGRMSVIAKGARSSKSRFGSTLEPLSHIQVVVFCKAGRDLQQLTETSHVDVWSGIRTTLPKLEIGYRMLELTSALMHQEEANPGVYVLLASVLSALDATDERIGNLWPYFQLRLAAALGFGPAFDADEVRALEADTARLDLQTGRIGTGIPGREGSRRALRAFAVLSRARLGDVLSMRVDPPLMREVESLTAAYVTYHVEAAYPNRAASVVAQLER